MRNNSCSEVTKYGSLQYRLTYKDTEIFVDTNAGMTITSLKIKEQETIWYSHERYLKGATYGIPILYPTPNSIADDICHYNDEEFKGKTHGAAKNQAFENVEYAVEEDHVAIWGDLIFDSSKDYFSTFPYKSKLRVTIILRDGSVEWKYQVFNMDKKSLGFGIAIHPFFYNEEGCTVECNANSVMHGDKGKIPDGTYFNVEGTSFDIRKAKQIHDFKLTTVYYNTEGSTFMNLKYNNGTHIRISADDNCTHGVLYVPENREFICLEPQTCSVDCHNLYNSGFKDDSNLIVVDAGDTYTGYFKMEIDSAF